MVGYGPSVHTCGYYLMLKLSGSWLGSSYQRKLQLSMEAPLRNPVSITCLGKINPVYEELYIGP